MVISRTKFDISHKDIRRIFQNAGFGDASDIRILGAGEFNSVFAVDVGGETYALKVGANNDAVQLYEKNMMSSEIHWYQVMAEQTDIRVPKVYFSDFSKELVPTNYFIMAYIRGVQKDELDLTPAQKAKADAQTARMTAKLHRVRGKQFGYIQTGLSDSWDQALAQIVQNLIRDAENAGQTLPRAEKLLEQIDRHREVLRKVPCRLISFDGWDPNFICVSDDPEQPEFVWIDPERCFWGDPILDFVTMDPEHWTLSEKTGVIAAYNEIAEFPVSATREEEIRYGFGLCYLAAIMDCEKFYRYSPDLPLWQRSIAFSDMLYGMGFSLLEAEFSGKPGL